MIAVEGPLPPGCLQTIWGDDARYVKTYWSIHSRTMYNTFDWGVRDGTATSSSAAPTTSSTWPGHRLGTREIEESISSHPAVAEVAVVGVGRPVEDQVAMAFAVLKDYEPRRDPPHAPQAGRRSDEDGGRPARRRGGAASAIHFVSLLPRRAPARCCAARSGGVRAQARPTI